MAGSPCPLFGRQLLALDPGVDFVLEPRNGQGPDLAALSPFPEKVLQGLSLVYFPGGPFDDQAFEIFPSESEGSENFITANAPLPCQFAKGCCAESDDSGRLMSVQQVFDYSRLFLHAFERTRPAEVEST